MLYNATFFLSLFSLCEQGWLCSKIILFMVSYFVYTSPKILKASFGQVHLMWQLYCQQSVRSLINLIELN